MDVAQLVQEAKNGNEESFFALMQVHKERLYRIAYAYLKNEHDALEAVQETAYRAWKTFGKLRSPQYVSTWLIRILLNCCGDEWKRRKRYAPVTDMPERFEPDPKLTDAVTRVQLAEALERLDPKLKQIIILKYYEDMTLTEIAETLDRPVGTVKTWLNKSLTLLKPHLTEGV
ncbi:sigma-70 family RNA polymerase sigma factor [Paenibacillus thermotolerans]|uniref:sigma-70 family RNA polymerase sigma factor n=1 Tax=Paenibacillus thermotolerans TaxID=3027807 RepID=UPI002368E629|nr:MULTISPECIES: sigma-70 family RNA polymerase sigma factor [unclassified Paenibacillus]